MTPTKRNRWATMLAAGALTFTLAACGGDDEAPATSDTPASAPASAPAGGQEGATAEPTEDDAAETAETTGEDEGGEAAPAAGEEIAPADFVAMLQEPGTEMLSTYEMNMTMKAGSEDMVMTGLVDLSGDSPKMDMQMQIPGAGDMQMVMADGRLFMAMPGVTEEGKFMEVPEEQLGDAATALDDVDITAQYADWEKTAKSVVLVGEEDVDGETMRRYEVTMDGAAMAEQLADAAGETAADAAAATAGLDEDMVYDIWLDEDNLMRRMVMEVAGIVTEMTIDKWGEPVTIDVPADSDLMDVPTGG